MEHFLPRIQVKTKKKNFTKNRTLFSPNSGKDTKKKGLHQTWDTFFPQIQVETCAQMHTRVKLLEGMRMETILNLLGGIQSNYSGGQSPPGFGTSACKVLARVLKF